MGKQKVKVKKKEKEKEKEIKKGDIVPFLETDTKILSEIIKAISSVNEPLLKEILSKYKVIPDIEIYGMIAKFNKEYNGSSSGDDEDEDFLFGRRFISISGKIDLRLDIDEIHSFASEDYFVSPEIGIEYRIIINKEENMSTMNSNKRVAFYSKEQRDIQLATLQKKLEKFGIAFI